MRKIRKIVVIGLLGIMMLIMSACGKKPADEDKIIQDLSTDMAINFLGEGETIESVVIEKRQTQKENKQDVVWCKITTNDEAASYKKEVIINYVLYDEGGWIIEDISVSPRTSWEIRPLQGVKMDTIKKLLYGTVISIDGEKWSITEANLTDIEVEQQITELDNLRDRVDVNIVLDDTVLTANGKLQLNYRFENEWKMESCSDISAFSTEIKTGKEFIATEDILIASLNQQKIIIKDIVSPGKQEVLIPKEEIEDFKIIKQTTSMKGCRQAYIYECRLVKPNATLNLKVEAVYEYQGDWKAVTLDIVPQIEKIDILGEWKGTYTAVLDEGEVVLNITNMSESGEIEAIYSFFPYEEDKYNQYGSYHLTGSMDESTLTLDLKAGDWIDKPNTKFIRNSTKADILAVLYLDKSQIKGIGHGSLCNFYTYQ